MRAVIVERVKFNIRWQCVRSKYAEDVHSALLLLESVEYGQNYTVGQW